MRTLVLSTLIVALWPWSVHAQTAPAAAPRQVAAPPASAPVVAPAVTPQAPVAPVAASVPPPAVELPAAGAPPAATPLPPPPEGYQYGPPPPNYPYPYDPQRQHQLRGELEDVDDRLLELQEERSQVSIGGPIAMTAAGFGTALIAGLISITGFAVAEGIEDDEVWQNQDGDWDWDDDGDIDDSDERIARNTGRVFSAISVVGVGVGIAGAVLLSRRLKERKASSPEIRNLKERRRDLRRELRYGASVAPSMAQLSISGQF